MEDACLGLTFAKRQDTDWPDRRQVASYSLAVPCYPGQEAAYSAKWRNIHLSLQAIDGTLVSPGETFSFWRCVARPTVARGYGRAAALKNGVLTAEIGGAVCFTSTLVYNVLLLAGLQVTERHCHSVDSYAQDRYFELGRDAAVEYAYRDLRAVNGHPFPVLLRCSINGAGATAEAWTPREIELTVRIDVAIDTTAPPGFLGVRTTRRLTAGSSQREETWRSVYRKRSP